MTGIEAMAAGRPIAATAVEGVPDVVLHVETGLLVLPRLSGQLDAPLRTVPNDEALRQVYGRAGQERAHSRPPAEA